MTNENEVRERINFVLKSRKLNARKLSAGDDNLWKKIWYQLDKGGVITLPSIEIILNAVPDLSTEWLFRGIGEPFVTEKPTWQVPTDTPQWAREMETRLIAALSQPKKTEISSADDTARNLSVKVSLE